MTEHTTQFSDFAHKRGDGFRGHKKANRPNRMFYGMRKGIVQSFVFHKTQYDDGVRRLKNQGWVERKPMRFDWPCNG